MEFLNNPDVIYVLLAGGMLSLILELASPGTGILEVVTLFILGAAGWGIITYDFPVNWWALVLILGGAVLFFISIRSKKVLVLLTASILAVVLGSTFLFGGGQAFQSAVNPWLAISVSVLSAGFIWIVGRKATEAMGVRPTHDLESLIGEIGETKSPVQRQGSIQVEGELWSARSTQPIGQGEQVRVTGRDGFTLLVEPLDENESGATN
jgi:membrane-bound serine protease (ClpP class)